jgi:hypothetical protein
LISIRRAAKVRIVADDITKIGLGVFALAALISAAARLISALAAWNKSTQRKDAENSTETQPHARDQSKKERVRLWPDIVQLAVSFVGLLLVAAQPELTPMVAVYLAVLAGLFFLSLWLMYWKTGRRD